jgi:hypothetical protein
MAAAPAVTAREVSVRSLAGRGSPVRMGGPGLPVLRSGLALIVPAAGVVQYQVCLTNAALILAYLALVHWDSVKPDLTAAVARDWLPLAALLPCREMVWFAQPNAGRCSNQGGSFGTGWCCEAGAKPRWSARAGSAACSQALTWLAHSRRRTASARQCPIENGSAVCFW